jgi:preprotein translocase subunit SecA
MGPLYNALGLSIGIIQHEAAFLYDPTYTQAGSDGVQFLRPVQRKEAYAADITYGTNNEFGFDYLRDNMAPTIAHRVQRDLHYAIVDEVDSILIDEARTPLIISAPSEDSSQLYYKFAKLVLTMEEGPDYNVDEKMRAVSMTQEGITKVERALGIGNIYEASGIENVHHIEQALKAKALFKRDKDYVVKEGEVIIVDEFTGRMMYGRRYSEGLHQAIEAKEGVEVKQESRTLATITFQNFFRLYTKLAGMTGTAATEAEEFARIYNLETLQIPTHKPMVRKDLQDRIYKTEKGKYQALAREIKTRHELGQPILIGTISIEKNELIADLLSREGVPCSLLNAKNHAKEAEIISQAGRKGAVTVATNMAGRGVDIVLGGTPVDPAQAEEVRALGGLHVIGTERHESRRIDNQLRGRSGRQGDPGSSQFYVSTEDDLMRIFGSERLKGIMDRLGVPEDMPIENRMISKSIESAQKKVEGHNFDIRKHLVEYDDVMNKHREVIYTLRREILEHSEIDVANPTARLLRERMIELITQEIDQVVSFHTADGDQSKWNLDEIYEVIDTIFPVSLENRIKLEDMRQIAGDVAQDATARTAIITYLVELSKKAYEALEHRIQDATLMNNIERALYLRAIDTLWIEHLDLMDHLRQGIGLRGFAQRDPLVEYKKEAYGLFRELMNNIQKQVVYAIYKVGPAKDMTSAAATPITQRLAQSTTMQPSTSAQFSGTNERVSTSAPAMATVSAPKNAEGEKVGRNDPCPCGSGKKYKKCHGK